MNETEILKISSDFILHNTKTNEFKKVHCNWFGLLEEIFELGFSPKYIQIYKSTI